MKPFLGLARGEIIFSFKEIFSPCFGIIFLEERDLLGVELRCFVHRRLRRSPRVGLSPGVWYCVVCDGDLTWVLLPGVWYIFVGDGNPSLGNHLPVFSTSYVAPDPSSRNLSGVLY